GLSVYQVTDLFDQRTRVDLAHFQFRRASVAQKIAYQTVEPCQLVLDRRQHMNVLGARGVFLRRERRAQVIDREVDEVERVADLVRDARSQTSDDGGTFGPLQQFFQIAFAAQPRKHFVERLRQRPHLLRPRNRRAEVQIALRHFFRNLAEFSDRAGDASGEDRDGRDQQKAQSREDYESGALRLFFDLLQTLHREDDIDVPLRVLRDAGFTVFD